MMLLLHHVDVVVTLCLWCCCIEELPMMIYRLPRYWRCQMTWCEFASLLMTRRMMRTWCCWGPDDVEYLMMMRTWCCWEAGAAVNLMLMRTWLRRIPSLLRGSVSFWVASEDILLVLDVFMMYYCTFHIYHCSGNHVRILHMVLPSERVIFTQSKLLGRPCAFWAVLGQHHLYIYPS